MYTAVRFTVAEYDRMIAGGVFDDRPDSRFELIHGEIREVPPPRPEHEFPVDLLNRWSVRNTNDDEVLVRIQQSLGISALDSVPIPDVGWMKNRNYSQRRPTPADVLLLIEVAASSLSYDRGEKAELYARAGIKDYWIVNVADRCIEVHRKPRAGKYREITTFRCGQSVYPLAFPKLQLNVSYLFPVK